jgi:hypothetical protein
VRRREPSAAVLSHARADAHLYMRKRTAGAPRQEVGEGATGETRAISGEDHNAVLRCGGRTRPNVQPAVGAHALHQRAKRVGRAQEEEGLRLALLPDRGTHAMSRLRAGEGAPHEGRDALRLRGGFCLVGGCHSVWLSAAAAWLSLWIGVAATSPTTTTTNNPACCGPSRASPARLGYRDASQSPESWRWI